MRYFHIFLVRPSLDRTTQDSFFRLHGCEILGFFIGILGSKCLNRSLKRERNRFEMSEYKQQNETKRANVVSSPRIKLKAPKATNVSLQSNFVDNLRHFRSQNKLKKAEKEKEMR